MYLKKIGICGFKSFADKTLLEFEPGITAIIGPNGCGKSNVADAIRWCLGEQSARSLRSHQMMDVIFNGSQSRDTTSMAEVSLSFDNSQNVLPIDYSEVIVTRRLFRSGESEYFINKSQCRLKDIRDLFLDTGIGTEGYSSMEQGKVEFILSAKPEQRRELFEEAAGVAKYKARREEALRKLDKVDIDMNRINDMLSMLKEQIKSLDTAARKARQYKKYQQDLKQLEIASLVKQIAASQKEIDILNTDLSPKTQEFEKLNTSLSQIDTEISKIRVEQMEKDEQYIKLQDELSQIKSNINLSDERIQQAQQREVELTERQQVLANEIETGTNRISSQQEDLTKIQALTQELSGQVKKLEDEYKEKESLVENIRNEIAANYQQENELKNKLFDMAAEKTNLHNEQNRLNSYQIRCQTQILALEKELNRLQEQITPIKDDFSAKQKEVDNFKEKNTQIDLQKKSLQGKITEKESQQKEISNKTAELKEKIVSLESKRQTLIEMAQKDPKVSAIQAVLGLDIPGLRGPVSSLIHINLGTENLVTSALGEKMHYMVADTIETAQKAIDFLELNNLNRVSFIVQDRLPSANAYNPNATNITGARSLLSLIQYDPALERVMHFLCADTFIVGSTIYGHAVVQGGGQATLDESLMTDDQIYKLDDEVQKYKLNLKNIADQEIDIKEELETLYKQRTELDTEFQKINIQLEIQENQLITQKQELEYMEKEISLNQEDIQKQRSEEVQTNEKIKGITESLSNIERTDNEIKEKQKELNSNLQELRQKESQMAPLLTESKVAWATQSNELAGRVREEERLKESVSVITNRIEQFSAERKNNETKLKDQKKTQETESKNLKDFYKVQEEQEKQVQHSLSERQALLQDLNKKTQVLHELKNSTEILKQEIHRIQLDQKGFDLKKQNCSQRLKEDYSCDFEDVKDQYINTEVQEDEISRLKRRIESIGPVNLAAPEEYTSLEERYNFLLNQQQDLLKAKEDLHQVITKINHNTRENFKKTFFQVQENFRNIYHQLFEGGDADLILTDENNLLESGVDIVAQPPGKKLQNIALLSGGEKALTAIALLFAFFMVKPSPFCILDEVDAPLDDANIGRFISMVKSFSAQSQFLIITHSKRTMEMANVLYGVTMEELGVSKIISVRLQKEALVETA